MITTTINIDVPNEFNSDLNDRFRDFFGRVIADIKYGLNSDDSTNICGQYELEIAEMLHTALVKGDVTTSVAENDITRFAKTKKGKMLFAIFAIMLIACIALPVTAWGVGLSFTDESIYRDRYGETKEKTAKVLVDGASFDVISKLFV